jgi:cysteinyl-tRNA synthetase
VIGWDSPWGRGRPGWHIECSAMIERIWARRSTSTAAGSTSSSPTTRTRSPRAAAPMMERRSPATGCITASSPWPAARRCRRASATSSRSASCWTQGHKGETLRLALLSAHYRQPLEWSESTGRAVARRRWTGSTAPPATRGRARWMPACSTRWPTISTRRSLCRGCRRSRTGGVLRASAAACSGCSRRIAPAGSRARGRCAIDGLVAARAEAKAPRLRRGGSDPRRAGR